jgi:penicillin-binding protein 2
MALRRGLIDFSTHMPVPCTGVYRLGNRGFKCWKKEGHGSLDLTGAIAKSCDVYFYQVGQRLGLQAIIQDGILLGFRDRTGIDLPSELSPQFPSNLEYFNKLYRGAGNWSAPATTLNFSIGQGENDQTLISMIQLYASLAGDGVEPIPYIVRPTATARHSTGLTDQQLEGMRHALIAVVEQGTAAASRHKDLLVAGKTGTAQNSHGKDHGWFIGFAPADHPQLVVGGIMEFAEHGTVVAPYVVNTLRRYLLGPTEPNVTVRVLTDESVQGDSAPRPIQLPDSSPGAAPRSGAVPGAAPRPDTAARRPTP